MGDSLCEIKNRGCCWYFPKFELADIHKMVYTIEGLQLLETIRQLPGAVIHPYYIHAKGFFDEEGYRKYVYSDSSNKRKSVEDSSIFFRACPFVVGGQGCTLRPYYRTFVCNFFICNDILGQLNIQEAFKPYVDERERYAR